jgi:disulfide bond formation protein DsbB
VCASTTPNAALEQGKPLPSPLCLHNRTTLIVVIATAMVAIATAVIGIATAVIGIATALELAPYGPLGILLVGDVNVEAPRVFKELQA